MHNNLSTALGEVRKAQQALQELEGGGPSGVLLLLGGIERKLDEVVGRPGEYACIALRELAVAAQANTELRPHLLQALSFLDLNLTIGVGGKQAQTALDVGEPCNLDVGGTTVTVTVEVHFPNELLLASLGG